jgi:hypothetical protein
MQLEPFGGTWTEDDPHARFKAEVAAYTKIDPLPTLENLSQLTGIPVGCLIRYVLVKWAASASEALLALEPIVLQQMQQAIQAAESQGSDEARLQAYQTLRQILAWLRLPASSSSPPESHPRSAENS